MLVLTRRMGEAICIGDGIVLNVNEVKAGRVSLGIQAPDHVSINRTEVFERKWKQTIRKLSEKCSGTTPARNK